MTMNAAIVGIVGAGAWGTALAQVLAKDGRMVTLYARDPALSDRINMEHVNPHYLPGISLAARICATSSLKDLTAADIVLVTTPAQFIRPVFENLHSILPISTPLINCAKGIELESGKLISTLATETAPGRPYGVLSGPNFAHEVAQGLPAAATLATTQDALTARLWATALHTPTLRPYLSQDVIGVELSGALKNVIAIACGIVEGKKLGQNARAALMARGMAEIRRLGSAFGNVQPETFLGLSGLGDLTLTCHSFNSRNFSLGVDLAQGKSLKVIMETRRTVAEGVATARAVAALAHEKNLHMPICFAVDHILHGQGRIDEVIDALLMRAIKEERA